MPWCWPARWDEEARPRCCSRSSRRLRRVSRSRPRRCSSRRGARPASGCGEAPVGAPLYTYTAAVLSPGGLWLAVVEVGRHGRRRRSRCWSCSIPPPGRCSRASPGRRCRRGRPTAPRSRSREPGAVVLLRHRDADADQPARRGTRSSAPAVWSPLGEQLVLDVAGPTDRRASRAGGLGGAGPLRRPRGRRSGERSGHLAGRSAAGLPAFARRRRWGPGSPASARTSSAPRAAGPDPRPDRVHRDRERSSGSASPPTARRASCSSVLPAMSRSRSRPGRRSDC